MSLGSVLEHRPYLTCAVVGSIAVSAWKLYLNVRQRSKTILPAPKKDAAAARAERFLKLSRHEFDQAQHYQKDKLSFSIIGDALDTVFSSAFLLGHCMPFLWERVPRLCVALGGVLGISTISIERGGFVHALLFTLSLDFIETLISLPKDCYMTFVVEERHGFNRSTLKTFVLDMSKSLALRWTLLHPLTVALLHGVVNLFGPSFPNYLFAGGAFLIFGFTFIYPNFIMPLFNKYTPLPQGSLKDRIDSEARNLNFPLTAVFEVDGSKRSGHSNAFFYGFLNNKRIVLFDTLLKQLEEAEIIAVLAHEFGHWFHGHTMKMMACSLIQLFAISHALKLVMGEGRIALDFGFMRGSGAVSHSGDAVHPIIAFQLLSIVILVPLTEVLRTLMNIASRRFEFQADGFAVTHGYGRALTSGLIKISKENKGNPDPDWLFAACNYSHPPLVERLDAIEKAVSKND